ncbi:MAG: hypothetical protein RML34_07225 [Leptospiraceae bacterium]|nr:hypothetical protein [Leptospiraceae bacterium]
MHAKWCFFFFSSLTSLLFADIYQDLKKAALFLEQSHLRPLQEELNLKENEVFHISEVAAQGRYLRYEISGREAYSEIRHFLGDLNKGLYLCKADTRCDAQCRQANFGCFLLREEGNTMYQVELPLRLPPVPERTVAEEAECPLVRRIFLPKGDKSDQISLDYFCEKEGRVVFLERKSVSFAEIIGKP